MIHGFPGYTHFYDTRRCAMLKQVVDKRGASNEVVMENIVSNSDFSEGLHLWQPNSCHAFVAVEGSGYHYGVRPHSGSSYAVLTHRTQSWQGLEQDITENVTLGTEYFITAYVRVHGEVHEPVGVKATLKFEEESSSTNYVSIARYLDQKVPLVVFYNIYHHHCFIFKPFY